jgi:TolB-like protein
MLRFESPLRLRWIAVIAAFVVALIPVAVQAQNATIAEQLANALDLYNALEFDKGLETANAVLERDDLTPQDSVAVYEVLSIITYAKGRSYLDKSFDYLDRISQIGPCLTPMPQDFWPQELRDRWYRIVKAQNKLTCDENKSGVKTIAIMQFDNFSTGEYQEKLGLLAKGLADFFAHDFAKVSDLKVIERDKIDFVLQEIELQKSGAVDKATAVQVGKILGAKYMVFGSITQLDDDHTRMVVRVVDVETSEIMTSVDKEGKPKYSEMEKDLVKELAQQLKVELPGETIKMIDEGGTDSDNAASYYARGLDYMDQYDYKLAYDNFKKAYELDPTFTEAKRKMEIYQPLAG